jgi:uncharacterized Zn-finger protein
MVYYNKEVMYVFQFTFQINHSAVNETSFSGESKPAIGTLAGNRRLKCNDCHYETFKRSNLITHMSTHTGDKPFECFECNYKATDTGTLNNHMRTHTGDTVAFTHR